MNHSCGSRRVRMRSSSADSTNSRSAAVLQAGVEAGTRKCLFKHIIPFPQLTFAHSVYRPVVGSHRLSVDLYSECIRTPNRLPHPLPQLHQDHASPCRDRLNIIPTSTPSTSEHTHTCRSEITPPGPERWPFLSTTIGVGRNHSVRGAMAHPLSVQILTYNLCVCTNDKFYSLMRFARMRGAQILVCIRDGGARICIETHSSGGRGPLKMR